MAFPAWYIIPAYIIAESAVVLVINAASDANGDPYYNSGSLVLVQELLKLSVSAYGLSHVPAGFKQLKEQPLSQWLKYGVPGLLYCINNNLFHYVVASAMPAAFQVLLNLRALWTGVMFYLMMGRQLTGRQWIALGVLCTGAILSQAKLLFGDAASEAGTADGSEASDVPQFTLQSLMLTLLYTWISVAAGVYNESLLKSSTRSIHLANVPLYMWGVAFNAVIMLLGDSQSTADVGGADIDAGGFWRGWDRPATWFLMVLQALIGLGISVLMRQFDNVVKILCVSTSNVLVYIVGVVVLGYPLEPTFVAGGTLVLGAAYVYNVSGASKDSGTEVKKSSLAAGQRSESSQRLSDFEGGMATVADSPQQRPQQQQQQQQQHPPGLRPRSPKGLARS